MEDSYSTYNKITDKKDYTLTEFHLYKSANDLKNQRRRRSFRLQSDTQQTLQKAT